MGKVKSTRAMLAAKELIPLFYSKCWFFSNFYLNNEEVEFQVNDRRMFEKFVGLGVMNHIPDATTVAFLESVSVRQM
jgi:transposase, IS5 family